MAEIHIIELLQESNDNKAHAWINIHVNEQILTVRVDAVHPNGFRVYLRADDSMGKEVFVHSD